MNEPTMWKEAAAKAIDDSAVESAFMKQAYGYVENKSKPLFKDPFRLGFEVVHKNEKSTKMIGMFAFRVGSTLIYAPVFFLNGDIKGADMLYRSDVKRFVPNNNEWCSFLVEDHAQEEGSLQHPGDTPQQRTRLERLQRPLGGVRHKSASYVVPWEDYPEALAALDESVDCSQAFVKDASTLSEDTMLLPKILGEGPDMMEKLANLLEDSELAQRYMMQIYTEKDFDQKEEWDKRAAAKMQAGEDAATATEEEGLKSGVVVYGDPLHPDLDKRAATRQKTFEYGYGFEDRRPIEGLTEVFTYQDEMKEISKPGVYDVCVHPENTARCLVLRQCPTLENFLDVNNPLDPDHEYEGANAIDDPTPVPFKDYRAILNLDNNEYKCDLGEAKIFGMCCEKCTNLETELKDLGTSIGSVKKGKVYVFVEASTGKVTPAVKVVNNSKKKDYREIEVEDEWCWSGKEPKFLLYREDYECANPCRGMFNGDWVAFEVKHKLKNEDKFGFRITWGTKLMSRYDIRNCMLSGKEFMKSANVIYDSGVDAYNFDFDGARVNGLVRPVALAFLAKEAGVPVNQAEAMVDAAKEDGNVEVMLNFQSLDKRAAFTQVIDQPHFVKDYDSQLGIAVDYPQRQILETQTHQPHRVQSHYGDSYKGEGNSFPGAATHDGLPEEVILNSHPDELAGLAEQAGLPQVFDHGLVGSLAEQTYDAIAQVEDYIPDLEQGLDRLGRILFLFRYKPSDFEEAYGSDNMKQMEQQITSEFSSHGDLVLRLIRRNRDAKTRSSNLI